MMVFVHSRVGWYLFIPCNGGILRLRDADADDDAADDATIEGRTLGEDATIGCTDMAEGSGGVVEELSSEPFFSFVTKAQELVSEDFLRGN